MMGNINIQGQLSIFDLPIVEKKIESVIKIPVVAAPIKVIKDDGKKITDKQQEIIDKYITNERLNRVIFCCGGGLEIELLDHQGNFKTIYVNTKGEEEFSWDKKASIIHLDKIVYNRDLTDIKNVQPGWIVEYERFGRMVEGTVHSRYGFNNETLNVVFNNKHTAIHISAVKRVVNKF